MIKFIKTDSVNADFIQLVKLLDDDLKIRDGEDHDFYNQFNNIEILKHVIVAYYNEKPVGCGAFKKFEKEAVEIKRMFVLPEVRGKQIGTKILIALEEWAQEICYKQIVLETGVNMPEAIGLYSKMGYKSIPNYGQYKNVPTSICFKKML